MREIQEAAALGVDITVPGALEKAEAELSATPEKVELDAEGKAI